MTSKYIINLLTSKGYTSDKSATLVHQYAKTPERESLTYESVIKNRNNTGWVKAEYIICEYDEKCIKSLEELLNGWKTLAAKYKNQYLILEVSKDEWKVYDYDGKELGGNEYIETMFEGRVTAEDSLQKIFFGCPGTGKSYKINKILRTKTYDIKNAASRERSFREFLKASGLKESSVNKYTAVLTIEWVVNIAKTVVSDLESLYDIKDPDNISTILENTTFIENDTTGKGMYSNALKHYCNFLVQTTFRTTFHPDTDYASFVGCFKPATNKKGKITYTFCPQIFTDAYITAWKYPRHTIYLIIEEINRGNCAQIFGDIFQLLDRRNGYSEYPIKADNDLADYIEKQLGKGADGIANRELCLPPNLIIYATMNTSDQSLFPMDSAFKRRWDWEYIPINPDCKESDFTITIGKKKYKWSDFIIKVNREILDLSESEDKQLGNFFIKGDISIEEFKSKVMFYLWSEVCKDYYRSGSFFKYKESEDKVVEFTFNMLFNASTEVRILQGFMEYLDVPEKKDDTETTEATTA